MKKHFALNLRFSFAYLHKTSPSYWKDLKETVGFLYSSRHNPFSRTAFPT